MPGCFIRSPWRCKANERKKIGGTWVSWKVACEPILVASSKKLLTKNTGDLWDSGKVDSHQTVNVVYGGKPLVSRQACYWKVCVWDNSGKALWSETASWMMGLLRPTDWLADYISFRDPTPLWKDTQKLFLPPAHQYRKEFSTTKTIKRATIYSTALGIYELYLNGQRVGDARFAPGWSDYHQSAYYTSYDVTSLIQSGGNALGAWVADGWYSGYIGLGSLCGVGTEHAGRATYGKTPSFMAQLEIDYSDGTRETILTDKSWKVSDAGPIREADILMGESYDARKETPGWAKSKYDDLTWESAILASENCSVAATFYEFRNPDNRNGIPEIKDHPIELGFNPPVKLESFPGVPVRPVQEIKPVAITSPTNGVYIFNLGQNFAGVARLKVRGPAGTTVQLRYGEMLHADGSLMTKNLRRARATDTYILRGDKNGEEWSPRFTYHGFQYVQVTGYPGKPVKDTITGIVLQSDTPLTSSFECSDPMANRLFMNVVWTQRANFVDLPTDCPQRDERLGWMGDAQIYAHCATLNADVAAFFTKWLRQVMEAQRPSGTFPGYCPHPSQLYWDFGTGWCDAGVIVPWTVWQAYDDTRIIERCWPNMVRFMDWRISTSINYLGINHGNGWGDWVSFGNPTPIEYVDTVYFAYSANLMSQMAAAIGKTKESEKYCKLFENIRTAFNQTYVKPDGSLTVDNQTAYALALYMDLLPVQLRVPAGKILADKLRSGETRDNSGMTTGFLGTRPLLPVLTSVGQNDLAVKHFQSRKFPSWGYEVDQGATTIWEHWNSFTKAYGFGGPDGKQNASMNSFSHYSLGAVCEWMINDLAGIQSGGPGYNEIVIHPHPPMPGTNPDQKPINWVKAHYDSIHGRITSNWRLTNDKFELETEIPANTTATVYLPAASLDKITESGRPLEKAAGVKYIRNENDRVVLAVGAGSYRFEVKNRFVR